jgi:hypothetical protein
LDYGLTLIEWWYKHMPNYTVELYFEVNTPSLLLYLAIIFCIRDT